VQLFYLHSLKRQDDISVTLELDCVCLSISQYGKYSNIKHGENTEVYEINFIILQKPMFYKSMDSQQNI